MTKKPDSKPLKITQDNAKTPKAKLARKKPSKKLIMLIMWVVLLLVVGIISFTVSRNSALAPNKAAERALSALKANDSTTVYNLGSDEFKEASDQKKVKAVVNQWSKVVTQATEGKPTLLSKQETTKDRKLLTTLNYRYNIKSGKSKVDQKNLDVKVVLDHTNGDYKLYTFNIDTSQNK